MATIINAVSGTGLTQTADTSGVIKIQSNSVTTNALAWVRFTGSSGTMASSYNVTSVTRSATGTYVVNFTNAQSDSNYSWNITAADSGASGPNGVNTVSTLSTSALGFKTVNTSSGAATDPTYVNVSVFGN